MRVQEVVNDVTEQHGFVIVRGRKMSPEFFAIENPGSPHQCKRWVDELGDAFVYDTRRKAQQRIEHERSDGRWAAQEALRRQGWRFA